MIRKELFNVRTFVRIDLKRLFRDKVAMFFVFAFPLIFLFVFGNLFGGDNDVSFTVGLINQSETDFAAEFSEQLGSISILNVDEDVTDLEIAQDKLDRSQIEAAIVLPPDFGAVSDTGIPGGEARLVYNQNNEQAAQTLIAILDGVFDDINAQFVPTEQPFSVVAESTAEDSLRQFDYVFSGLLGFSLLSLGIFGPTQVFPRMKQRGVLRRYHAMPLKVWQYFVGNVISNAITGLLSIATMFVVALLAFNLVMKGSYLDLAIMAILGAVMLFGIGLAIGGWAKNENQAAPLSQLVAFPLMFLSGVFFPRFLMPDWLQAITEFFPLTPVIDGFRLIITEGESILNLGPQVGLVVGWAAIIYIIAFRVFRWE